MAASLVAGQSPFHANGQDRNGNIDPGNMTADGTPNTDLEREHHDFGSQASVDYGRDPLAPLIPYTPPAIPMPFDPGEYLQTLVDAKKQFDSHSDDPSKLLGTGRKQLPKVGPNCGGLGEPPCS